MIRFYLVRHGETEYNVLQKVQGWCDSPLTEKGKAQAHAVGQKLSQISFCAAFSGDLQRQQETARIILSENTVSTVKEPSLDRSFREFSFGSFEEKLQSDMLKIIEQESGYPAASFPELLLHVNQESLSLYIQKNDTSGKTEPASVSVQRFTAALQDIAARETKSTDSSSPSGEDRHVLIVSSGGILRSLLEYLSPAEGIPPIIKNGDILQIGYRRGQFFRLPFPD